jgi:hypothetical protein
MKYRSNTILNSLKRRVKMKIPLKILLAVAVVGMVFAFAAPAHGWVEKQIKNCTECLAIPEAVACDQHLEADWPYGDVPYKPYVCGFDLPDISDVQFFVQDTYMNLNYYDRVDGEGKRLKGTVRAGVNQPFGVFLRDAAVTDIRSSGAYTADAIHLESSLALRGKIDRGDSPLPEDVGPRTCISMYGDGPEAKEIEAEGCEWFQIQNYARDAVVKHVRSCGRLPSSAIRESASLTARPLYEDTDSYSCAAPYNVWGKVIQFTQSDSAGAVFRRARADNMAVGLFVKSGDIECDGCEMSNMQWSLPAGGITGWGGSVKIGPEGARFPGSDRGIDMGVFAGDKLTVSEFAPVEMRNEVEIIKAGIKAGEGAGGLPGNNVANQHGHSKSFFREDVTRGPTGDRITSKKLREVYLSDGLEASFRGKHAAIPGLEEDIEDDLLDIQMTQGIGQAAMIINRKDKVTGDPYVEHEVALEDNLELEASRVALPLESLTSELISEKDKRITGNAGMVYASPGEFVANLTGHPEMIPLKIAFKDTAMDPISADPIERADRKRFARLFTKEAVVSMKRLEPTELRVDIEAASPMTKMKAVYTTPVGLLNAELHRDLTAEPRGLVDKGVAGVMRSALTISKSMKSLEIRKGASVDAHYREADPNRVTSMELAKELEPRTNELLSAEGFKRHERVKKIRLDANPSIPNDVDVTITCQDDSTLFVVLAAPDADPAAAAIELALTLDNCPEAITDPIGLLEEIKIDVYVYGLKRAKPVGNFIEAIQNAIELAVAPDFVNSINQTEALINMLELEDGTEELVAKAYAVIDILEEGSW